MQVAEDALGGTPVLQVQAIDPDRDQVTYAFVDSDGDESVQDALFQIDPDTGRVRGESDSSFFAYRPNPPSVGHSPGTTAYNGSTLQPQCVGP